MPKEDVLTIGNIYENGDTTYKTHQTATKNVACSEEELKKENELAFILSCLACMSLDEICDLIEHTEVASEILYELAKRMGYGLE